MSALLDAMQELHSKRMGLAGITERLKMSKMFLDSNERLSRSAFAAALDEIVPFMEQGHTVPEDVKEMVAFLEAKLYK
jgi:hypothetical protein